MATPQAGLHPASPIGAETPSWQLPWESPRAPMHHAEPLECPQSRRHVADRSEGTILHLPPHGHLMASPIRPLLVATHVCTQAHPPVCPCLSQGAPHCLSQGAPHCLLQGAPHCLSQGAPHCLSQGAPHCLLQGAPHCLLQGAPHCLLQGAPH